MSQIQDLYLQFLGIFPSALQPFISIALAIFLVYSIVQALRRNFIFLIVLVILLPASIPILKTVGQTLLEAIKFLLGK